MASGGASPAPSVLGFDLSQPAKGLSNLNPNATMEKLSTNKTKICVFCGASKGNSPAHMEAARALAREFHKHDIALVYGGGTVGLMGEVARTLVQLSGPESVHGIIPSPLVKYERSDMPVSTPSSHFATDPSGAQLPDYKMYGKTTVVKDMHTRKQLMAQEVLAGGPGSGFVALSGGYGTLEELMEVVTWNQLGIHNRGVVVFNVEGYWNGLLSWIRNSVEAGFVGEGNSGIVQEATDAEGCVRELAQYKVAEGRFNLKWGNE